MTQPYVRVDVWTLAENDPIITAYADAVVAMQQKSSVAGQQNDPTGWLFQAAMHGTENGPPQVPSTPPAKDRDRPDPTYKPGRQARRRMVQVF